jgi:hypothetical protein
LPPSSAEVRNEWSYNSTPYIIWHVQGQLYLYLIKVALLQVSPSELTIDIKDEPEEIRSEPAPPGMD